METDVCSFYSDDELTRTGIRVQGDSDVYKIRGQSENTFSHFIKGYPMQGWGNVKNAVKPMSEAKGEVKIKVEWGKKEGAKVTVSGSVSAKDDDGNYVEATASQDNNGDGKVEVTVGTETKDE